MEANRNIAGNDILLVDDVEEMRNYVVERHEALELERVDLKSNIRGLERVLADEEAALAELLAEPKRRLTPLNWWLSVEGVDSRRSVSPRNRQAGFLLTIWLGMTKKAR